MFQKLRLKKQLIYTFIVVLVCSIVSVLIVIEGLFYLLTKNHVLYKANYHEQNSTIVQDYIQTRSKEVLDSSFKNTLEKDTPISGIKYQVIDNSGSILYGNMNEKIIANKKELLSKINTFDSNKNIITRYAPILDNEGSLQGSIIFKYPIRVTPVEDSKLTSFIIILMFLIGPFIFIILYTFIFGSKLAKNINKPLKLLIDASNNIKNNDLDFDIYYPFNNELGSVISSFNSMKNELKNTLNKKWQLEQDRKDMVSALSHDLKTPLTIIKGHVELLQEGAYKKPERLERYLEIIENNTDRSISLVQDLNTLSKIERPDFRLIPVKLNLSAFINEKELEYTTLCKEKNVELILNKDNIESDIIIMDSLRISEVMDNLFSNSLRFTPKNGKIEMNISSLKDKINFSINDSGKGFNNEELNNVFKKFYQGDKSRSEEKGHSGLGLYICKLLIEKHGGEIVASNNNDGGALISFYIKSLSI
ncbi:HAMP domain-containing protein [Clostridium cavendishii DSM 21758]|uniref:histidine kinase n=1 Tax=Clostridium cavendishii DSM 21758 TaxID=1121302 RepID=A0A1M6J1G7_9CLOT|nr:HAMP domain-containing sensor histidine kinase [Clostridium cavendishii]SHJ40461.1 HAMP domain-containing protein [Clostridium cavendishii DSM 21758]